jgi:hypothetical protein
MNFKEIFSIIKNLGFSMKRSTLMNKHSPSENRGAAFDYFKKLLQKAIENNDKNRINELAGIILGRLSYQIPNSIKDSEEKEYIKNSMKSFGEYSVEPVQQYIVNNESIAIAIELLYELKGREYTLGFLESILTTEDSLFNDRLVEKRIEIMKQFGGETFPGILGKAKYFLDDSDDRLVIASIRLIRDYLFDGDEEEIRTAVIDKLVDPETSTRIRIELFHVLIKQDWKVAGYKKKLEELLPSGYFINAQGFLRVVEQAQTKEEM